MKQLNEYDKVIKTSKLVKLNQFLLEKTLINKENN